MRRFKYILLSLGPTLYKDMRSVAKRRHVSVSTLIRIAVNRYLLASTEARLAATPDPRTNPHSLSNQPLVNWIAAERMLADQALQIHFEADR
jgi:hypothetical protein